MNENKVESAYGWKARVVRSFGARFLDARYDDLFGPSRVT